MSLLQKFARFVFGSQTPPLPAKEEFFPYSPALSSSMPPPQAAVKSLRASGPVRIELRMGEPELGLFESSLSSKSAQSAPAITFDPHTGELSVEAQEPCRIGCALPGCPEVLALDGACAEISGVAGPSFRLECRSAKAAVSGACESFILKSRGSFVDAQGLAASGAEARLYDSGMAKIFAKNFVRGNIEGFGQIRVHGNPAGVDIRQSRPNSSVKVYDGKPFDLRDDFEPKDDGIFGQLSGLPRKP